MGDETGLLIGSRQPVSFFLSKSIHTPRLTASPFVIFLDSQYASSLQLVSSSIRMLNLIYFGLVTFGLPVRGDKIITSLSVTPLLYFMRDKKSRVFLNFL